MPDFTLKLSQKTVDGLQGLVQAANENTGLSLTVTTYLELAAQEMIINPALQEAVKELQAQAEEDAKVLLQTTIATKRQELLDGLADPATPEAKP